MSGNRHGSMLTSLTSRCRSHTVLHLANILHWLDNQAPRMFFPIHYSPESPQMTGLKIPKRKVSLCIICPIVWIHSLSLFNTQPLVNQPIFRSRPHHQGAAHKTQNKIIHPSHAHQPTSLIRPLPTDAQQYIHLCTRT
jgi:hypothetical protein